MAQDTFGITATTVGMNATGYRPAWQIGDKLYTKGKAYTKKDDALQIATTQLSLLTEALARVLVLSGFEEQER